jgi:CheY-like chemotaxis protein
MALTILLIDDHPLVARAIRMLCRPHTVEHFGAADVALPAALAGAHDLILCDLDLPGGGAPAFYDPLLAAAPEKAARVFFVSGAPDGSGGYESFVRRVGRPILDKADLNRALPAVIGAVLAGVGSARG